MYNIILKQENYNRIELKGLERDDAIGIMFDLVGHMAGGSIELAEEKEEPQTGGNQ